MSVFLPIVLNPAGVGDPALAVAAGRAGAVGVLNLELPMVQQALEQGLAELAAASRQGFGIKLGACTPELMELVDAYRRDGLRWLIVTPETALEQRQWIKGVIRDGTRVLVETSHWQREYARRLAHVSGWIVKGQEAGGVVGEESSFILLQRFLQSQDKPVYVRGGIGIHTGAACLAAGAAGVVLDNQLLLLKESPLRERLVPYLGKLVGNETVALGDPAQGHYYRVLERPDFAVVKALRKDADVQDGEQFFNRCRAATGWDDPREQVMPLGQDVAFAGPWAERYGSLKRALRALRQATRMHLRKACKAQALGPNAPLAKAHGTRLPIVQGPMTRVSDTPGFAAAVAREGGLPMLALALLRGNAVRKLLAETHEQIGDRAWGVGLLGFAPADLLEEQIAITREYHPSFALIAGGRPGQALDLEKQGIPSYLHVPSPRLLSLFLEQGARRFVFEGRECGGHIGPLTSFVLWESMVDCLLGELDSLPDPGEVHVLFAGGIHDSRSAAMVATLAAPLTSRGVRIGVLMGSAYLFTREIVAAGSIVEDFQKQALACEYTVSLETGPGHASRCADTTFAGQFFETRRHLLREGKGPDEIREALEELNLGRLRLASKGMERTPEGLHKVAPRRQRQDGMYMIGQVATLQSRLQDIADLHHAVTAGAVDLVRARLTEEDQANAAQAGKASDIAIIGMGALLPKAGGTRAFWENILNRVDAITEIPRHRWDWRRYFDADRNQEDMIYSKWGGFLEDYPFDPLRYGLPPKSLRSVDPMQLLVLEVIRQALEDAGYDPNHAEEDFDREKVSVILGASGGAGDVGMQYGVRSEMPRFLGGLPENASRHLPEWTEDTFAGILLNVAAGRAANRYDFGGLNFTVDAACASSLAAVYQAVVELEDGRSDMVLVGGVDTVQGPFGYLCFSQTQALSPKGRCRTFDAASDGIVISEGVAVLALKRLADAERDGDRIYAVIKGVGGSSDGRAKGLTAPHPAGQVRALSRAYGKAGFSPASVDLFEAHGTGTVAGDSAELETVTHLLQGAGAEPRQSAIGSVKTLIGHTKATAGVAGLIKATLALHHRVLPPHANVETPNPRLANPDSPLYLVRETQPWVSSPDRPRRAGVSAFGFGGTNFHVALEEYRDPSQETQACMDRWAAELLVWQAGDRDGLVGQLGELQAVLNGDASLELRDLAANLSRVGGSGAMERIALVARDLDEVRSMLPGLIAHLQSPDRELPAGAYYAAEPITRNGKVAVMFPGQGAQYPDMLRELAVAFPEVREAIDTADGVLAQAIEASVGTRLSRVIYPPARFSAEEEKAFAATLTRTELAQPALGAVGAGLWDLFTGLGLAPDMVAGHSYGEYLALYAAGVLDKTDLLRVSEARGRFVAEAADGDDLGGMAAVRGDRERVEALASEFPELIVANHNAPNQSVLSGPRSALLAAVQRLADEGISARPLAVAAAFHSSLVAPAQERLGAFIQELKLSEPRLTVYSNTTGRPYPEDPARVNELLTAHLAEPVEFVAEVEAMYQAGARLFIELGPRAILSGLVREILGDRPHRRVAVDDRGGGITGLLHTVATLWVEGVELDLAPLYAGRDCRPVAGSPLAATGRGKTPSPHTWMINGSGVRPISEPASPRETPIPETRDLALPETTPATSQVADPWLPPAAEVSTTMTDNQPTQPVYYPADSQEAVMEAYHETMRRFLQTQESIMLAYLGTAPTTPALEPPRIARRQTVMSAAPEPIAAAPPPAPAPAQTAAPPTHAPVATEPPPPPPESPPPVAVETAPSSSKPVEELLLEIVEDRTGYPRDMLGFDQDLEADLGIDSIKRVEIVGALLKALPKQVTEGLGDAAEKLNSERTLKAILTRIQSADAAEGTLPFEGTGTGADDRAPLPRFVIQARSEDVEGVPLDDISPGLYLLTDDRQGMAEALAAALENAGASPVVGAPEALLHDLRDLREQFGPVRALVHLAPLASPILGRDDGLSQWRTQTDANDKALFRLVQGLPDLRKAGRILSVSGLGGLFGRNGSAPGLTAQGGAVGLLKSLAEEWPETLVKAVDLDPATPVARSAELLMTELRLPGGRREVGYPGGRRTIFRTEPAPLPLDLPVRAQPDAKWVILATGGARGITSEVLRGLAPFGVRLILAGRTPWPEPEAHETLGLTTEQALQDYLIQQARTTGQTVTPMDIRRRVQRLIQAREMLANRRDLENLGARVEYRAVDVADETQLGGLLDTIYRDYGRLDGVIHGAGIIEDRQLTEKSQDSWYRVFDTKTDSAYLLVHLLRPETLRFLVLFTSVAGRYGNSGQTDYGAANELLNRLAWQVHGAWHGRVKVAAINWGPWDATQHGKGMVTPETRRKFEARGVTLVDTTGGRALFLDEILKGPLDQVELVAGQGPWEAHEAEAGALPEPRPTPPADALPASYPLLAGMRSRPGQGGELLMQRRLDLGLDHYLNEHPVDGVPVLPAAVALELMAEAAAARWPDWVVAELRELRLMRGIRMDQDALDISVALLASSHGDAGGFDARLELRTGDGSGPPSYRVTARLAPELAEPVAYALPVDGPTTAPLTMERAYREWLFHGPCFQTARHLRGLDRHYVIVDTRPSDPRACLPGVEFLNGWLFDPGLVDSAPQMALVWARAVRDESALPNRLGRVTRYGDEPLGALRMVFRLQPDLGDHQVRADVAFVDEDGRLRLAIEDLECTSSPKLNRLGGGWKGEVMV